MPNPEKWNLNNWDDFAASRFQDVSIASFAKSGAVADVFMKQFHERVKINQLRNFFGEIKKVQNSKSIFDDDARLKDELAVLEMNLAYDYGRNVITKEFYQLMVQSLSKIITADDFSKFVTFIKSLIAYHKFHAKGLGEKNA